MKTVSRRLVHGARNAAANTRDYLIDTAACAAEGLIVTGHRVHEHARAADDYVHVSPWGPIGVAALAGLLAGLALGRR